MQYHRVQGSCWTNCVMLDLGLPEVLKSCHMEDHNSHKMYAEKAIKQTNKQTN